MVNSALGRGNSTLGVDFTPLDVENTVLDPVNSTLLFGRIHAEHQKHMGGV